MASSAKRPKLHNNELHLSLETRIECFATYLSLWRAAVNNRGSKPETVQVERTNLGMTLSQIGILPKAVIARDWDVAFKNEPGRDFGGLYREFCTLVSDFVLKNNLLERTDAGFLLPTTQVDVYRSQMLKGFGRLLFKDLTADPFDSALSLRVGPLLLVLLTAPGLLDDDAVSVDFYLDMYACVDTVATKWRTDVLQRSADPDFRAYLKEHSIEESMFLLGPNLTGTELWQDASGILRIACRERIAKAMEPRQQSLDLMREIFLKPFGTWSPPHFEPYIRLFDAFELGTVWGHTNVCGKAFATTIVLHSPTDSQVFEWLKSLIENDLSSEQRSLLLRFWWGVPMLPGHGEDDVKLTVKISKGAVLRLPAASTCKVELTLSSAYTSQSQLLDHIKLVCDHAKVLDFSEA